MLARPPWPALLACASVGVVATVAEARTASIPAFCGAGAAQLRAMLDPVATVDALLRLNPPGRLTAGWAAMLLAMTPLLLAPPVMHVWRASVRKRRPAAVAEFVLAYGAVWMFAGGPVLAVGALLAVAAFGPLSLAATTALALAWSASPSRRTASNRAHRLDPIRASGTAATRSCIAYGLRHGGWCLATCWPWMVVPLTAGTWHLPAMALAGAAMLADRLAPPGRPRWRVPAIIGAAVRPSARMVADRA